jgi:hypothetical protein
MQHDSIITAPATIVIIAALVAIGSVILLLFSLLG